MGTRIEYKTLAQIRSMRQAGLVVARIHKALREAAVPGITGKELDQISLKVIESAGAKSNFLGYHGFPGSTCISINEQLVHGIPSDYVLQPGDLVSFDCGAYIFDSSGKQWHGDAAFSMIVGGDEAGTKRDRELNQVTEAAMWAGVCALARGKRINAVGKAVEEVVADAAAEYGWEAGIVEEFVGHGIGTQMHMAPDVPNFAHGGRSERIKAGMVLAIEPILSGGSPANKTLSDGWTTVTKDGSRAAHWEHTVAITAEGISVLTAMDLGKAGLEPFGLSPVEL